MTTERIAAAIKPILDEDRRADRERIAELERDAAHFASVETTLSNWQTIIDDLNKQIDDLTEKCAALVVENKRLLDSTVRNHSGASLSMMIESELKASQRAKPTPTLRIDTDMSDPQPGKLLVVRIDDDTANRLVHQSQTITSWTSECVGFLVETPAVEVKEQGPWVVYDEGCTESDLKWRTAKGWFFRLVQPKCFPSREDAQEAIRDFGARAKSFRVITLAEARAIEAKR